MLIAIALLLTGHAGVSAEAAVELTVDQGSIKKPLSKKIEDAVDFWPRWGRQGPRLPAALIGAGEEGRRGRRLLLLLLLLLLGCFGWLTTTALQGRDRRKMLAVADNVALTGVSNVSLK